MGYNQLTKENAQYGIKRCFPSNREKLAAIDAHIDEIDLFLYKIEKL